MSSDSSPLSRVLRNFGLLMGGRAVAGVLSVLALTLAARFLGPQQFGVLVLVHTTALVVRGLLNFKPSDTVVRYGVSLLDDGNLPDLGALLRYTRALDITTALLATMIAAVAIAVGGPLIGGVPENIEAPATLYGLTLLLSGTGTPRGVLRICNRFDAISVQQTIGPLVRLTGVAMAYVFEGDLEAYLTVWAVALMAEYAYMHLRGLLELRRRGIAVGRPDVRGADGRFPGIWRFVGTLYWQSNLDLLQRHGLVLLAGVLLGAAEAGVLRVAREFADVLAKPVTVVRQAAFPDLARLWRDGDGRFISLYVRLAVLGGAMASVVVAVVAVFGPALLHALVGADYVVGAPLLTWLMVAAAVELLSAPLRPAAYAMGAAFAALRIYAVAALCHVTLFVVLVRASGLMGAGVAAVTGSVVALLGMGWLVARGARHGR